MFVYGWLKQSNDDRLAGLNTLKFSVWISRGAGLALGIDGLLLTLPGKSGLAFGRRGERDGRRAQSPLGRDTPIRPEAD